MAIARSVLLSHLYEHGPEYRRVGIHHTDATPVSLGALGAAPGASPLDSPPVGRLTSHLDTRSDTFLRGEERMRALCEELSARLAQVREGGGAAALERHRGRGKLPVRERIDLLLDPDTAFLELSPLAAFGLYDDEAPGAGLVTGIGQVHGRECVIVANDATVKGGTYYPLTVKKHLRAQEIASAEPPPVHLPGRLGRRVPAAAGRGLPRPRPLRAHLLQPGAHVGATASRSSRP